MFYRFLTCSLFFFPLLCTFSVWAQTTKTYPIPRPVVTQSTSNTNISVSAGDILHIEAGGCVQTGGSGLTWKRYVDPSGPDADRYFHGTISIPGIRNGDFIRIANYIGNDITIPAGSGGQLQLGYEDNNYSDNSYEGHDNGTENQCVGQPDAYVNISVTIPSSSEPTNTSKGSGPANEPANTGQVPTNEQNGPVKDNPLPVTDSTTTTKPFLETATGIIAAIAAFIAAIVGLFQLFKKR